MLDAFCFMNGVLLFLKGFDNPTAGRLFVAGVVCGFAGLTRYQSYVLLFMPLAFFAFERPETGFVKSALFYAGFGLVNMPWWYYNVVYNGSPLYSWNYMNVSAGVLRSEFGHGYGFQMLWHCAGMSDINSVLDVLIAYPRSYVRNVLHNLVPCIETLVKYGGALALFVPPALFEGFVTLRPMHTLVLFLGIALSVSLVSQAYVNPWYLINWFVVINILCVAFSFSYFTTLQEKYALLQRHRFRSVCIILLIAINLILTGREVGRLVNKEKTSHSLVEKDEVAKAMKRHDPHIDSKIVMSIDPARAFYAGSYYLMTPLEYNGSVEGLVSYQDLSDRYKRYAPRYPSQMSGKELKADYLVYTRPSDHPGELQVLQEFSFLLDPKSERVPENFRLVYLSQDVVVYEIQWR
jgi:hypothetical protein